HDSGDDADEWHPECVRQHVDCDRIHARRFHVLLDANGGAGGYLGYKLLAALGATPFAIGENQDGNFRHPPEPLAENLQSILPLVSTTGADVGFVLDPDADRLAMIDETGRYIGEELTLALAVLFRLRQERGPVVINMSSSRV